MSSSCTTRAECSSFVRGTSTRQSATAMTAMSRLTGLTTASARFASFSTIERKETQKMKNNRLSKHHILPISRGGRDKDVVFLPCKVHDAYHRLFSNLTLEEAHTFLDVLMTPGVRWYGNTIMDLQCKIRGKP